MAQAHKIKASEAFKQARTLHKLRVPIEIAVRLIAHRKSMY